MPIYHLSKISIAGLYGRTDFDIDFENQQRISFLLGPNGSGKSTILKIIKSFLDSRLIPHSGTPVDGFSKKEKPFFLRPIYEKLSIQIKSQGISDKTAYSESFLALHPSCLTYCFTLGGGGIISDVFSLNNGYETKTFSLRAFGKGTPSSAISEYKHFAGFIEKSRVFCINDEADRLNRFGSEPNFGADILELSQEIVKFLSCLETFSKRKELPSFPNEYFAFSLYQVCETSGRDAIDRINKYFSSLSQAYLAARSSGCLCSTCLPFFDDFFNRFVPNQIGNFVPMFAEINKALGAEAHLRRPGGDVRGHITNASRGYGSDFINNALEMQGTISTHGGLKGRFRENALFHPFGDLGSLITELFSEADSFVEIRDLFNSQFQSVDPVKMLFDCDGKKGLEFEVRGISGMALIPFSSLSSGQKNVITMLANACFKRHFDRFYSYIYLLDEPEVSLHVAWQHDLVDALVSVLNTKNTQIIITTHSPFVVGKHLDLVAKTVCKNDER
jgi:ABC-type thiamine transport system ATPase subunit